jgi:NAD(P)-dependent dehydrogenase (short-subunit alcohol dehydrogenase family)
MRLKDRVALVTGGARGIGLGITRRLASEGAITVIGDVREDLAGEAAAQLTGEGGRVFGRTLDVRDSANVDAAIDGIVRDFGKLDFLVNNAGVHLVKAIAEYTDEDWAFVMDINARGPFFTMRAASRHMMARRSGKIVNVVTILTGTPYSSLYEASKHAVMGLTKCLMYELAPFGITVNAVSPGAVDTELLKKGIREKAESAGVTPQYIYDQIASTTPLGRLCTPEDVAAAITFLLSSDADYITGELIHVTGGTFHQNLGRKSS